MGSNLAASAALSWLLAVGPAASEESSAKRLWLEAKHQKVETARSELSKVARAALPAVVSITTLQQSSQDSESDAPAPQTSMGSGFIINAEGFILTGYHVVEDAAEIRVAVNPSDDSDEVYPARIVGRDEQTDIALLKINAGRKLPVLPLGSTSQVDVADWVVVIGSPFGMANSVTVGVVSYKGRTGISPNGRNGYFDYLQTDAPINPGNSGGPVLNLNGEVIAISSAVNVSGQGIGFAIPIETAKEIIPQLWSQGLVRRAWIGASVMDSIDFTTHDADGVVVSEVRDGGPASKAGLQIGDVITNLGSTIIRRADVLRGRVARSGIGEWVELSVRRDGKPLRLKLRLEEMPTPSEKRALTRLASDRKAAKND